MTEDLIGLLAEPGQPNSFFEAMDAALATRVSHRLLTLLYKDGDEVARVYSNMPDVYPVFGRKPMGITPWGDLVVRRQRPFLGRDHEAVKWAFFDYELIAASVSIWRSTLRSSMTARRSARSTCCTRNIYTRRSMSRSRRNSRRC